MEPLDTLNLQRLAEIRRESDLRNIDMWRKVLRRMVDSQAGQDRIVIPHTLFRPHNRDYLQLAIENYKNAVEPYYVITDYATDNLLMFKDKALYSEEHIKQGKYLDDMEDELEGLEFKQVGTV